MTTLVPKGTGRPAAEARRNKHAQRTPLPPRPGQVEAAKVPIQREAPDLAAALDRALPLRRTDPSQIKAAAFVIVAKQHGWTGKVSTAPSHVRVTASRGDEHIECEWAGGVFQDTCYYSHPGRSPIKLKNASAAKQRMQVPPDLAAAEATRVSTNKVTRAPRAAMSGDPRPRRLPFSEASLDQEVLDALYGRKIYWTNRISGAPEEDHVPSPGAYKGELADGTKVIRKQNYPPRITEYPSGRTLEFVGGAGFRSVLLSQITRVR
jgi:hypothetical protein